MRLFCGNNLYMWPRVLMFALTEFASAKNSFSALVTRPNTIFKCISSLDGVALFRDYLHRGVLVLFYNQYINTRLWIVSDQKLAAAKFFVHVFSRQLWKTFFFQVDAYLRILQRCQCTCSINIKALAAVAGMLQTNVGQNPRSIPPPVFNILVRV